jgi:hypothetical protein
VPSLHDPHPFDPAALDQITDTFAAGEHVAELPTWLCDQRDAATVELRSMIERSPLADLLTAGAITTDTKPTPRKAARMFYAMVRHITRGCSHAGQPKPVAVIIDAGAVCCFDCFDPLIPYDDDQRCRLCDTVPSQYQPIMMCLGPALFCAEACPACAAEMYA